MTARVLVSAAHELFVALYNVGAPPEQVYGLEWAERLQRERPDLAGRVRSWWPDATGLAGRGAELLVMAAQGGCLAEAEPGRLFAMLPGLPADLLARPQPVRPFPWYPDVTELVRPRMEVLRDPAIMAEYLGMLREVWSALEPDWQARGWATVQTEALEFRQRLEQGASPADLLPRSHLVHLDWCRPVLDHYLEHDRVAIMPSYFAQGHHAFDIGDTYCVGYALQTAGLGRLRADRAALVAGRMKAFSDPTRLTILAYLSRVPVSVSDLAAVLAVSQPTVSEHLRLLRDAGLVTARREGNKVYYRADRDAARALLQLAESLTVP